MLSLLPVCLGSYAKSGCAWRRKARAAQAACAGASARRAAAARKGAAAWGELLHHRLIGLVVHRERFFITNTDGRDGI